MEDFPVTETLKNMQYIQSDQKVLQTDEMTIEHWYYLNLLLIVNFPMEA